MKAESDERRLDHEHRLSLAWHTAGFQRMKRMPSLARVLGPSKADGQALSRRLRAAFKVREKAARGN